MTLAGSHEEREYDIRPNERYISARLGWTRRLSPYTNLFAGVGWRRTEIDGDTTTPSTGTLFGTTAPESDTYSGRIALMQTLAKDVFGNVSFGHTTRVADQDKRRIYRELPDLRRTDRVLMFEDFYKLVGPPFKLGPDHRFFFPSKNHDKALSYLRYGLQQDEGFIVVTGDIGAGKTTLVSQLFSELDKTRFLAAQIVTSNIDADDALRMILSAFGVTPHSNDKAALLRSFESFLMAQHRAGRRVLMVVDEAQNLPTRTIEELRMLSNFSVGGQSLFQSFLVGQPQFKEMLADPSLEQFRQRVIASYHLGPMSEEETAEYIRHRLHSGRLEERSGDRA